MQHIDIVVGADIQRVELPDPDSEWTPGLRWGDASFLLTPAWIAKHAHMRWRQGTYSTLFGQRHNSLAEELVFCVLSGFGIKAEVALAAFQALKSAGILAGAMDQADIENILAYPVTMQNGRAVRYRFPKVRADYLHGALAHIDELSRIADGLILRNRLVQIRGIGTKTASFIARNHLGCDKVAILDIHVLRAGVISRIFPEKINLAKDYQNLEGRFLAFAEVAGVPASILDMTIWEVMRTISPQRLEAANRLNMALTTIEGLAVPQYDPSLSMESHSEGIRGNGWKQQQELSFGDALI